MPLNCFPFAFEYQSIGQKYALSLRLAADCLSEHDIGQIYSRNSRHTRLLEVQNSVDKHFLETRLKWSNFENL